MRDIEFMWAGGYTDRYHTHRTLLRDTVGHHSFNVACVIMHLRPEARAALLKAALLHDVAEHKVGDVPAPAKRAMGIREAFTAYEQKVMGEAGVEWPLLTNEEKWVLELADAIDGLRFCLQERRMGNVGIEEIFFAYRQYVCSLLYASGKLPDAVTFEELRFEDLTEHARLQDHQLYQYLERQWNDLCK